MGELSGLTRVMILSNKYYSMRKTREMNAYAIQLLWLTKRVKLGEEEEDSNNVIESGVWRSQWVQWFVGFGIREKDTRDRKTIRKN